LRFFDGVGLDGVVFAVAAIFLGGVVVGLVGDNTVAVSVVAFGFFFLSSRWRLR
jgi:hypothetical protein